MKEIVGLIAVGLGVLAVMAGITWAFVWLATQAPVSPDAPLQYCNDRQANHIQASYNATANTCTISVKP